MIGFHWPRAGVKRKYGPQAKPSQLWKKKSCRQEEDVEPFRAAFANVFKFSIRNWALLRPMFKWVHISWAHTCQLLSRVWEIVQNLGEGEGDRPKSEIHMWICLSRNVNSVFFFLAYCSNRNSVVLLNYFCSTFQYLPCYPRQACGLLTQRSGLNTLLEQTPAVSLVTK